MSGRDLLKGESAGMLILFKEFKHVCTLPFMVRRFQGGAGRNAYETIVWRGSPRSLIDANALGAPRH
jgi:hypothetical protein